MTVVRDAQFRELTWFDGVQWSWRWVKTCMSGIGWGVMYTFAVYIVTQRSLTSRKLGYNQWVRVRRMLQDSSHRSVKNLDAILVITMGGLPLSATMNLMNVTGFRVICVY